MIPRIKPVIPGPSAEDMDRTFVVVTSELAFYAPLDDGLLLGVKRYGVFLLRMTKENAKENAAFISHCLANDLREGIAITEVEAVEVKTPGVV